MGKKIEGKYFGTEINEKWWKRYSKDKMLARGNGIFSFSHESIQFLRKLTTSPIEIDFKEILDFKTGKWHAGQWGAGRKIIKVIWKKNHQILSSGFSIALGETEIDNVISELTNILKNTDNKFI